MLELGFAEVDSKGKTDIPMEQLKKLSILMKHVLFWMEASATEVVGQRLRFILPIYPILAKPQLKLTWPLQ